MIRQGIQWFRPILIGTCYQMKLELLKKTGTDIDKKHSNYCNFHQCITHDIHLQIELGGGPRVVVSTAAFHARVRGSVPGLGGLKETKNVSSSSTCESQYCGEPPWPRGSVLGLRPPGLEFRILCLEDSVISIFSPSSGGSPSLAYMCTKVA